MTKFKRQLVPGSYLTAADMLQVLSQQQLTAVANDGCVVLAAEPAVAWLLDSCCVGRFLGETQIPVSSTHAGVYETGAVLQGAAGGAVTSSSPTAADANSSAGSLYHKALQAAAAAGVNRASEQLHQQFLRHQQQVLNRRQRRAKKAAATPVDTTDAVKSAVAVGGIIPPPADSGVCSAAVSSRPPPPPPAGSAATAGLTAEAAAAFVAEARETLKPGQQVGQQRHENMDSMLEVVHMVQLDLPEAFFLVHVLTCCRVFRATQAADVAADSSAEQQELSPAQHLQGCEQSRSLLCATQQPCQQHAVRELSMQQFWEWSCGTAKDGMAFVSQYAAYHHFRSKGWLPRSGLLYGADYVLYQLHPEHAHSDYVVSVIVERGCGMLEAAARTSAVLPATQQKVAGGDLDKLNDGSPVIQQKRLYGHDEGGIRTDMSWLDAHILQRLARQVLKQLLLLYVVVPEGFQLQPPECIRQLAVREVLVKRWVPADHRDDGHVDFHARRYMGLFEFMRPHERHQDIKTPSDQRTLVIPVDDSQHSLRAVEWAVQNVYKAESDELHLLSVVPRVAGPYPAEVLDADVPAACSSTVKAWRSEQHAHESETLALLSMMQHHAVNLGVKSSSVKVAAITATGGASGVGASIADYVAGSNADLVVLGSRDLHGWQRHIQNLLGLGSVSYYTLLRVPCPVLVVKGGNGTSEC